MSEIATAYGLAMTYNLIRRFKPVCHSEESLWDDVAISDTVALEIPMYVLTGYSSLSHARMVKLLEHYAFLKNVDTGSLLNSAHREFYSNM